MICTPKRQLSYAKMFLFCLLTGFAPIRVPSAATQSSTVQGAASHPGTTKRFAFEVLSIRAHKPGAEFFNTDYRPDGYRASFTVEAAIKQAYFPQWTMRFSANILNAPDWLGIDWYDIDARVSPNDMKAWQQAQDGFDSELLQSAFQGALEERFKLSFHTIPVEVPCINLFVGSSGAKLRETVPGAINSIAGKTYRMGKGFYIQDRGKRQFVGVSMDDFVRYLTRVNNGTLFQDKTGLSGRYDFSLPWTDHDSDQGSEPIVATDQVPVMSIGLLLKHGKTSLPDIVIDHVERPTAN